MFEEETQTNSMAEASPTLVINTGNLVFFIAGMISTLDFVPANHHPEKCLEIAEQVIDHIRAVETDVSCR